MGLTVINEPLPVYYKDATGGKKNSITMHIRCTDPHTGPVTCTLMYEDTEGHVYPVKDTSIFELEPMDISDPSCIEIKCYIRRVSRQQYNYPYRLHISVSSTSVYVEPVTIISQPIVVKSKPLGSGMKSCRPTVRMVKDWHTKLQDIIHMCQVLDHNLMTTVYPEDTEDIKVYNKFDVSSIQVFRHLISTEHMDDHTVSDKDDKQGLG